MRARIAALAAALVIALAAPAGADEEANKTKARAFLKEGARLLKQGKYEDALELFYAAYDIYESPLIVMNIGTTLRVLGRHVEAANAYQRYLDSGNEARRDEIVTILAEMDVTLGRLQITVNEADTSVTVGEVEAVLDEGATLLRVSPGRHTVTATKPGFEATSTEVEVAAGQVQPVALELVAEKRPGDLISDAPEEAGDERPGDHESSGPARVAAADSSAEPAVVTTVTPERRRETRPIGFRADAALDYKARGVAAIVGVSYRPIERIAIDGAAILGPTFGAYAGARFHVLVGRLRPTLGAGVPLFADDGAHVGLRGAAGLEYWFTPHVAATVTVAVEHYFDVDPGFDSTVFVPMAGLATWL